MSPIPTNGRDGAPMPSKPENPPTSKSGVSGEPLVPYAPFGQPGILLEDEEGAPFAEETQKLFREVAQEAYERGRRDREPVGPYAPTRGTNGALLREWLAEQFGVLPTHIWTEDRVVKPLGARVDGLVDVVLRQEARILEAISGNLDKNGRGLDGDWLQERFDVLTNAIDAVSEKVTPYIDGAEMVTKGFSDLQYDKGVADGRASVTNLSPDVDRIRAAEFERGKAIGASEREAELLDQGWTPPGAVISWADNGTTQFAPTDADLWETALQIAGSQRNRRVLEPETVRRDAEWFYRELKAGPPPGVIVSEEPIIDGDEDAWEMKTFPAGRIDGE